MIPGTFDFILYWKGGHNNNTINSPQSKEMRNWPPRYHLLELQGRQTHTDLHGHFIRATYSAEEPYHSAMDEMDINELTYLVNGAIFEVNRELWAGFLEKVYEKHRRVRRERRENVEKYVLGHGLHGLHGLGQVED